MIQLILRHRYLSSALGALFALWLLHLLLGWAQVAGFGSSVSDWLVAADNYRAVIRRGPWGIPHIEGDRDEDVAFGAAFVQAVDALEDVEQLFRLHKGRMGMSEGLSGSRSDWLVHLLRSQEIADSEWDQLPEKLRSVLQAYADGLNYFAAENPDRVDRSLYPISGHDLMAASHFQQIMFYGFGDILAKLVEGELPEALPAAGTRGSNAIAIAPGRGWGATHLLINSHQPLTGPFSWYELRISSKEGWDMHGGTFPGSPFVYLGVNKNLGWGATVNKPGLTDLYRLELHAENPRRYRFDGVWWDMEVREVEIPVRLIGNFFWTFTEELEYTQDMRPVFRIDGEAYALHYAGAEQIRQTEQWYRMNKAKTRSQWFDAMRIRALPSLNFVYADAEGNIDFLYNAELRRRPDEFVDMEILPGNTSAALKWQLHAFEDLPQVHNPDSGWLASTNQTPLKVTAGMNNPRAELYGKGWRIDSNVNNRALRVEELFARSGPIDRKKLKAIKLDKTYSERFRHLDWRASIMDGFEPEDRLLEDAQRELVLWDLGADAENPRAAIGICMVEASREAEQQGETFELVRSMRSCASVLENQFGTLARPWGEILRLRRGEQSWPLGGGPDLLRAIHSKTGDDGTRTATAGDGLTILASWQDGQLNMEVVHQFGSSRLPTSPHYADQAPLFSAESFRPEFDYDQELSADNQLTLRVPY